MTPCGLMGGQQRFGGTCCPHVQGLMPLGAVVTFCNFRHLHVPSAAVWNFRLFLENKENKIIEKQTDFGRGFSLKLWRKWITAMFLSSVVHILESPTRCKWIYMYSLFLYIFALHVSGTICTHPQEHKLQSTSIGMCNGYGMLTF
jgi:hypothetical protein